MECFLITGNSPERFTYKSQLIQKANETWFVISISQRRKLRLREAM